MSNQPAPDTRDYDREAMVEAALAVTEKLKVPASSAHYDIARAAVLQYLAHAGLRQGTGEPAPRGEAEIEVVAARLWDIYSMGYEDGGDDESVAWKNITGGARKAWLKRAADLLASINARAHQPEGRGLDDTALDYLWDAGQFLSRVPLMEGEASAVVAAYDALGGFKRPSHAGMEDADDDGIA